MTAVDNAVTVQGLNKYFGAHHAVKDLSMQIRQGEIFGFLGPNGSGKTTSIRMMCGLLTPDSGSGTCLGYDITLERAEVKRRVGYMTQRFSYWEDLSIRENLDFVARLYQVPNRKAVVDATLEELQLTSRATQLAGSLSGGWKQRLALAAALLHKPKLLLLDEPTAGVDPTARRIFWEELHRLAASGISILVSTHYMDEAERCHRLAYISYGELLCQGTAAEMIQQRQLTTWQITGQRLVQLNRALEACPGVEQVVAFGNALHVSGTQAELLRGTIEQHATGAGYDAKIIDTSLEDVFINLMKTSERTFN
ncbi:ABC transporter ATP-binding protein [Chromobacterium sp. ASV23]|uniref:ABC transporter ATP-binding protein n=1 Tax=Chromobacterium sp. ASV23 TaxID=2795110 RepID=UPI001E5E44F0|nr:ABC transporter ATP-binding protein [Chromobacterium sp. ASV23]